MAFVTLPYFPKTQILKLPLIAVGCLIISFTSFSQNDTSRLSLLFAGDIMVHDTQLNAVKAANDGEYSFYDWFTALTPLFDSTDIVAGNLELKLGVQPYSGYPRFSSPPELAIDLQKAGFDLLFTANNHSQDRKTKAVNETIRILDSLQIMHTGSFQSKISRSKRYPLIVEKKGFKLAFLNYTYGTNGIPDRFEGQVNRIDKAVMGQDIQAAKEEEPDMIIVCIHWGKEYETAPNQAQESLMKWFKEKDVDVVVGMHPHVLQPMEWDTLNNFVGVYSLGNFVSNMYKPGTDGGGILSLQLEAVSDSVWISDAVCQRSFVYKYSQNGYWNYRILPLCEYKDSTSYFRDSTGVAKMRRFQKHSKAVLKRNKNLQFR